MKTSPKKYKEANPINTEKIIGRMIIKFNVPTPKVITAFNALLYLLIPFISFEFSMKYSAMI